MMEDVRNDGSNGKACPFNDWTAPADLRIDGDMGVCNFHMYLAFKKNMCRAMMSSERGKTTCSWLLYGHAERGYPRVSGPEAHASADLT